MIRTVFILIIIMFTSLIARSQVFEGGFFAGLSASQVEGDSRGGFDKIGITAGGYIQKEHLRRTNMKMELRYIQKGSAQRPTETDPTLYKLTIHYVELPFLYQFELKENIILEGGLTPDIYLAHKEEDENGLLNQDDQPDYHRFGLNLDLGIYYRLSDPVLIGLRFSNSILAMRDHASSQVYYLNRGQYHRLFHFGVYLHFD